MNHLYKILPLYIFIMLTAGACQQKSTQEASDIDFQRIGNSAIIRQEAEPDRLTPLITTNNYANQVMYETIFLFLEEPDPETLNYQPCLIEKRPVPKDVTEGEYAGSVAFTFDIHDAAVWDDGRPVTGNDYLFTFKAILNPKVQAAPFRPYAAIYRGIEVDPEEPKHFTVYADKSIETEAYVTNLFVVLPEHLYDPEGYLRDIPLEQLIDPEQRDQLADSEPRLQQFADQFSDQKYGRDPQFVSGCGPYRLVEWTTGQRIVLEKKENWWGDALAGEYPALQAFPRELIFQPIPDAATYIAAMKGEEIDLAYNIDPNGFEELQESNYTQERFDFFTPPIMAYSLIYLNTKLPELSDKRVRKALAHVIDVQEIIDNIYNGIGERLATPVLPSFDYRDPTLKPYEFDIDQARELLAEAGWEDSNNNGIVDKEINGELKELELELFISAGRETQRQSALLVQDNARRAGISIQPVQQESSVLFDNLRKRNYEMAYAGRGFSTPLWNPKQSFHTLEGDNRTGFGDAETDALIDEILVTLDKEKRDSLYKVLQARIYEEVPEIPMFVLSNRIAIHKRFETTVSPLYPGVFPRLLKLRDPFREEVSLQ
jgi:peptide/nickel transport system substrate-binding protein